MRWLVRFVLLAVLAVLGLQLWYAGWIAWWRWNDPQETAFMRRERASLQARNPKAELKHRWVPYHSSGAEIVTARSGQQFAKWTDRKTGRTRKKPLNAAGDRVTIESGNYLIAYHDAAGKRQEINSGTPNLETAEQIVGRLKDGVALRKMGFVNAQQEQVADAGKRTLAQHLADFQAGMVAAGRTSDHVTRTVGFIREFADAASFASLADITADGVNRFASALTTKGRAARTVQARLTAIKAPGLPPSAHIFHSAGFHPGRT